MDVQRAYRRRPDGLRLVPLAALWTYCEIVARQHYPDSWITLMAITGSGGIVLLLAGAPIVCLMQRTAQPPVAMTEFSPASEAR
jgi:hypothetical protein